MNQLDLLLVSAQERGASDLHITSDSPPMFRINGSMVPVEGEERLNTKKAEKICIDFLSDAMKKELRDNGALNFTYEIPERAKYRAHIFFEGGSVGGHFRRLNFRVPALEELGLPKAAVDVARFNGGLALISGPMRSGRTTTVASMIQRIIDSRPSAVLTVENPVEFDLISKGSVISHREIGRDVISLETAVEALGKEDFDICFFGDVTGKSAFRAVAQSSITGVMTFACTYANSASETLDHFFAGFDESERSWVARMVSNSLRFVINQKLIPGVGGRPVLASELLLPTPSIRKAIRAENFDLINESILADGTKAGMVTMNQSLMNLLVKRKIELRNAFESSPDPDELDQMLKKAGI